MTQYCICMKVLMSKLVLLQHVIFFSKLYQYVYSIRKDIVTKHTNCNDALYKQPLHFKELAFKIYHEC